jgi:hypothetical protein
MNILYVLAKYEKGKAEIIRNGIAGLRPKNVEV